MENFSNHLPQFYIFYHFLVNDGHRDIKAYEKICEFINFHNIIQLCKKYLYSRYL